MQQLVRLLRAPSSMRWLLWVIPSLFNHSSQGQAITEPDDLSHFVFARNHASIAVVGGLSQKAVMDPLPSQYGLRTSAQVAFGGGFGFHQNFSRVLSLEFGLQLAAPVRNLEYEIEKEAFNPPAPHDLINQYGIARAVEFYAKLPVSLEFRRFHHFKKYLFLSGGISLNYRVPFDYMETHAFYDNASGQLVYPFVLELHAGTGDSPWLNLHASAGHGWLLNNLDIFRAGLIYHYSAARYVDGEYSISDRGRLLANHTYYFKGSYGGITVSYIRTGAKKKLKKLQQVRD